MFLASLVTYSLHLWFLYYLLNHAELTKSVGVFLKESLGRVFGYPISCPACLAWWVSFAGCWLFDLVSVEALFAAPVVVLFIELIYRKLNVGPTVTLVDGDVSYTGPSKTWTNA